MFVKNSFRWISFLLFACLAAQTGCASRKKLRNVNNDNLDGVNGYHPGDVFNGLNNSGGWSCELKPLIQPGAQIQPGTILTMLFKISAPPGNQATKATLSIQGLSTSITLPTPTSTFFQVNPFLSATYVGNVEGPSGAKANCTATITTLAAGGAACPPQGCYGIIVPMPTGIDPGYGTTEPSSVVHTFVNTTGLCSKYRQGWTGGGLPYSWFASASDPILTAESEGLVLFYWKLKDFQYRSRHTFDLPIDLKALKTLYPTTWSSKKVSFQVCENSTGPNGKTNKCLDKLTPTDGTHGPVYGISKKNLAYGAPADWEMSLVYDAGSIPASIGMKLFWEKFKVAVYDPAYPNHAVDANCDELQLDPLVMNFSDENLGFKPASESVFFDLKNLGIATLTGWLAPTLRKYGFLAVDHNGNGSIDHGGEMFGNYTYLPGGIPTVGEFPNGFEALGAYDGNQDYRITESDPEFENIRIWFDENADGKTDPGELVSLAEMKVRLINVAYTNVSRVDKETGNAIYQESVFETTDGKVHPIYDVWFSPPPEKSQ